MKSLLTKTAAGIALAGAVVLAQAQDVPKIALPGMSAPPPAAAAPTAPAAAPANYTEPQVLEVIGWLMGRNTEIDTFALTTDQLTSIFKGFSVAAADKDAPYPLEKIGPQVDDFVKKRQESWLARLKSKGEADTAAYFAALKSKPGVVILPSGLAYEIIKQGTGPTPKATDTVTAHYEGRLISGEVFDTSREPREAGGTVQPAVFPLDGVIPGWTEGIQKIGKGGQIKLYIPPKLGYGDDGRGNIPPASTLIFDVELLDFKPTPGPASLNPTGK